MATLIVISMCVYGIAGAVSGIVATNEKLLINATDVLLINATDELEIN